MDPLTYPTYTAYFSVGVPVDHANRETARAREIIARYLYGGAEILGDVEVNDDLTLFTATVVTLGYQTGAELARRVQTQRDRFASGLYPTTDPMFMGPMTLTGVPS
jgi:hypothetical protein